MQYGSYAGRRQRHAAHGRTRNAIGREGAGTSVMEMEYAPQRFHVDADGRRVPARRPPGRFTAGKPQRRQPLEGDAGSSVALQRMEHAAVAVPGVHPSGFPKLLHLLDDRLVDGHVGVVVHN